MLSPDEKCAPAADAGIALAGAVGPDFENFRRGISHQSFFQEAWSGLLKMPQALRGQEF